MACEFHSLNSGDKNQSHWLSMVLDCCQDCQDSSPKAKLTKDQEGSITLKDTLIFPYHLLLQTCLLDCLSRTPQTLVSSCIFVSRNFKFLFKFHYWSVGCSGTCCLIFRCLWCFWDSSQNWFLLLWHHGLKRYFDLLELVKTCLWPHHVWLVNLLCYHLFSKLILFLFVCMWVSMDRCTQVHVEAGRGHWISWNWS